MTRWWSQQQKRFIRFYNSWATFMWLFNNVARAQVQCVHTCQRPLLFFSLRLQEKEPLPSSCFRTCDSLQMLGKNLSHNNYKGCFHHPGNERLRYHSTFLWAFFVLKKSTVLSNDLHQDQWNLWLSGFSCMRLSTVQRRAPNRTGRSQNRAVCWCWLHLLLIRRKVLEM